MAGSADRALSCCQAGSDRAASVIAKLWLRGTHVNGGGHSVLSMGRRRRFRAVAGSGLLLVISDEEFAEDLQVAFRLLGVSEVRALLEYDPLRSADPIVDGARYDLGRLVVAT